MDSTRIDEAISTLRHHRFTLYLNADRVKEDYDAIGGVDGISTNMEIGRELGGGFKWVVEVVGKLTGKKGFTEQKELSNSPMLMALTIEAHYMSSQQLLELPKNPYQKAQMYRYVGASYITGVGQDVTSVATGLPDPVARVVQAEKLRQQKILGDLTKQSRPESQKIVWTAQGEPNLVSIAQVKWVMPYEGYFSRFTGRGTDHYGILGRWENEDEGVVFLAPLWIWYQRDSSNSE